MVSGPLRGMRAPGWHGGYHARAMTGGPLFSSSFAMRT